VPAIDIRVLDVSGSRACAVEAPDDVAINRILVLLVEKMNLPLNSPDGQIMSYKLHHRRSGSQLLENQTLAEAGVRSGDELRIQPEITAGGAPRDGRGRSNRP
jgi:hypothetical protein